MNLCKECALKAGREPRDAELMWSPGLYRAGAKPLETCAGCGNVAICLDVDPAAPNGCCQDCGKPKERPMWGRCAACQKVASAKAAAKLDLACTAAGIDGPAFRADIARWARQQLAAMDGERRR